MQIRHVMAALLRKILRKPALKVSTLFASNPSPEAVNKELDKLYRASLNQGQARNRTMKLRLKKDQRVVIFSDQHKGDGRGADDFTAARGNYIAALEYYNDQNFYFINLGDCEELWKFDIEHVYRTHRAAFDAEARFAKRKAFFKVFGNHDIFWNQGWSLNKNIHRLMEHPNTHFINKIYNCAVPVYEAITIKVETDEGKKLQFFCTHGHQGDGQSDGNRFSVWFINNIWGPLQNFLKVNINTPANDSYLKSKHNKIMYQWSKKSPERILITGHTHQPIFNSLTHIERLYLKLYRAEQQQDTKTIQEIKKELPRRSKEYATINAEFQDMLPTYFNTGCCCFSDGTITGIEISNGAIRLAKWSYRDGKPVRIVAEEENLDNLWKHLHDGLLNMVC
ncbi:MAG: metallophosphoesterase [Chitinophagaceae bacterium]